MVLYTPATLEGDVSWLAVPYMGTLDCPFFAVWRDPTKIISSFMEIGFFRPNVSSPYKRFASKYFLLIGDPAADSVKWCIFHLKKALVNAECHYRFGVTYNDEFLGYMGDRLGEQKHVAGRVRQLPSMTEKFATKCYRVDGVISH